MRSSLIIHKPFCIFILIAVLLVGCATDTTIAPTILPQQVDNPATSTPIILSTDTPQIASPTIEFTPTSTNTSTPMPTFTSTPQPTLGLIDEGVSAWCLPEGSILDPLKNPSSPPEYANIGNYTNGNLEINNLPVAACIVIYHFNQDAPSGLKLEIYDNNPTTAWLISDLSPVEGDSTSLFVTLTHSYLISPPFWNISYIFIIRDESGKEFRRDQVNLNRWVPERCWNGNYPNLITLRCPLPLDLHPWDAGYGTPMPTFPPEE